jgi:predicted phosphoribosyltransferase
MDLHFVRVDSRVAQRLGAQFEAVMLERVLAPMQGAFGQFGEVALGACARTIAEHDAGGFAALIATALARSHVE